MYGPEFWGSDQPDAFSASDIPSTVEEWEEYHNRLLELPRVAYMHACWVLARTSLYFLVRFVLSCSTWLDGDDRPVVARPFVLNLCNEVQQSYDNVLDIAARGHLKSTVKTLALPIQVLLNAPETTIGIFSFTRQLAKNFLRLIKAELETSAFLKALSYDFGRQTNIFWSDPVREAPVWSLLEGLSVNRSVPAKESSVEAWGLVESMPVGRHFMLRLFDDVVVPETVTTPEQTAKAVSALSMAQALGMPGGKATYTGTFYAAADPHCELLRQGVVLRLKPCYEIKNMERDDNGQVTLLEHDTEHTTLFSHEELADYTKNMLPSAFGTQMLCDPRAGVVSGFEPDWMQYYKGSPAEEGRGKTIYITVDPANAKKKTSDYTAMWVLGLGDDRNYYVLDGVRDRLNMKERCAALFRLHRKWNPIEVAYEKYGKDVDVDYIKVEMERQQYRFRIREVGGNRLAKEDRIERLIPLFASERFYFPKKLKVKNHDGTKHDLVQTFLNEEYLRWPVTGSHDDMLDSLSRITDVGMHLIWPKSNAHKDDDPLYADDTGMTAHSWMVA